MICPVCGGNFEKVPHLTELIEKYKCPECGTELRKPVIRATGKNGNSGKSSHQILTECKECISSDKECCKCGDPVCDVHMKQPENLSRHVSSEFHDELMKNIGSDDILCAACFLSQVNRIKNQAWNKADSVRYKGRRFPWLIFLPILVLIILFLMKVAC